MEGHYELEFKDPKNRVLARYLIPLRASLYSPPPELVHHPMSVASWSLSFISHDDKDNADD